MPKRISVSGPYLEVHPWATEGSPVMNDRVVLQPVDAVDVTILIDNTFDSLLPSTEEVRRPAKTWDWSEGEQLIAEHGYSLLLSAHQDTRTETLLYDAGVGRRTLIHNMDVLGLRASEIRAVVLSHGHVDHHAGLTGLHERVGRQPIPLVLHPDAWRERKVVLATGDELRMPPPSRADLNRKGWEIVEERGPSVLFDGAVLVTGQIERTIDFEKGLPDQQALTHGTWEPDVWVWDDQALACHVKDKGLVVLSSCSHSGVINVLRYVQRLTGIERVHAFVGGLHLTGGQFEPIIPRTMEELVRINPKVIVPGHCTGWKATHELARRLPTAYVQSSVGTCLHFG